MEELLSSPDAVLESRKELITSPFGEENPIFRTAHFLKPSTTSIDESFTKLSSNLLSPVPSSTFEARTCGLSISFSAWRNPQLKWKNWVAKMSSLHQSTWKKAGVYEAILNSTYNIHKNSDLILGVAERWCPDTRSFIFPWGEATITLEDMVIAGYSALGSPVFPRLDAVNLRRIEEKLIQARKEVVKTPARKASQSEWMKKFMNSGSKIEHEAFLALWLSRFVLPTTSSEVISSCVFPIAIQLARGTRIALAPAVLASIYRDLRLLKEKIASLTIAETETSEASQHLVAFQSPFQLVQVWIWERFVELRPNPNFIKCGETRLSRWDKVKCKVEDVRMVLASATTKDRFTWRPYAKTLKNWNFPKFYAENGMLVLEDSTLHDELMSFVKCLRVSGLVGLDCVEKYLPHRVAMQFGYDQDLPGCVDESNPSPEMAWIDYSRPLGQVGLYIPSRAFEGGVTTRYKDWWEKSMFVLQGGSPKSKSELSNGKKRKEGGNIRKYLTLSPKGKGLSSTFETSMGKKRREGDDIRKYFTLSPKGENLSSRLETSLKETKEGDTSASSSVLGLKETKESAGASSSVLGFGPKTSSEISLMTAKRKKTDDMVPSNALTAETSEPIFKVKSEENAVLSASPCSSNIARKSSPGYTAAINNSPVPPGFPPKCKEVVAIDDSNSAEEDNLTFAELSNRRTGGGQAQNLSRGFSFQLSSRKDGVDVEVEKQVGNGGGVGGGISSGQCAEKGGLRNLEGQKGQCLEKAEGGNAAATSKLEMSWLKLQAEISWIEKRLLEMRKRKK